MSAQLASHSNSFSAHLALAAGVSVSISAATMADLASVVDKLQPAANDAPTTGKSKPAGTTAATAPAGSPATTTAASSAPAAAAQAAGDAGNATTAGQAAAASPASSSTAAASPEADNKAAFEVLKKAFLALSTKADGRAKCEGVLASVDPKPARLSDAKPEQYPALMAAIEKAAV